MEINTGKRCNTLLYLAVGDAAGKPFEAPPDGGKAGIEPYDHRKWNGRTFLHGTYEGLGEYGKAPGRYTDDTQMSIIAARLLLNGAFSGEGIGYFSRNLLRGYCDWITDTNPETSPRGVGGTVDRSLRLASTLGEKYLDFGASWAFKSMFKSDYCGCGTAMRATPYGIVLSSREHLLKYTTADSDLTHPSKEAQAGSFAVAMMVSLALCGGYGISLIENVCRIVAEEFPYTRMSTALKMVPYLKSSSLRSHNSGDVVDVVASAMVMLLCFMQEEETTAKDIMKFSVGLGGDVDSRTAILCAWIGSLQIQDKHADQFLLPESLTSTVENSEILSGYDAQLLAYRGNVQL